MIPEHDFSTVDFGDKRLLRRLQKATEDIRKNLGRSILGSGKGRSQAKAFYRLLSNDRFDLEKLLKSAKDAAISRLQGTVLAIQDTTDYTGRIKLDHKFEKLSHR